MSKYDSYKDSGIDVLGDIPSNWIKSKFKFQHIEKDEKVGEKSGDYNLLSLTKKGIILRDIESGKGKFPESFDSYKIVRKGDLIFCLYDIEETPRTIGLSDLDGMITGSYKIFKTKDVVPKFTYYTFLVIDDVKGLKPYYTGLRNVVRPETFKSLPFNIPTLNEQKQIVEFLDTKTELIDSLIEKTERKIELLKEKRTSLINETVTKGLNPNVEMKDSGVEWIGKIPSGWKFLKLWLIIKSSELGGNYNSSTENEGIPMMKMGNIERGKINLNKIEYVDEPYKESHFLKFGDFLFNTRNSIDLVGKVCVWRNELEKSIYNSNILRIDFKDSVNVEFMNYQFNSKSILDVLRLISKGTTSVSGIYYKDLSKIEVVLPPLSEQHEIVSYLDKQTQKIDKTISIEEKRIELLKEYRQSLISEVVTGKLKVTSDE